VIDRKKEKNGWFYLRRLAAEIMAYANPTASPKVNGIHTPKACSENTICWIKLWKTLSNIINVGIK
jgi:hypothetical protein